MPEPGTQQRRSVPRLEGRVRVAAARPAGECHLGDSQGGKNAGLRTEEVSEAIPRFPGELWMENRSIEVVGVGIGVKVQPEKRAQLCGVTELRGPGWAGSSG